MNQSFKPDTHSAADLTTKLPSYLSEHYPWAYTTERAVRFWDRPWLTNLILWGNYRRLCNIALQQLGTPIQGHCLQLACVYGELSGRLLQQLTPSAQLHLADVAPVQLRNAFAKFPHPQLKLHLEDSATLNFEDDQFDSTLLFFLLHEQPETVRRQTLKEALRVTKPGGELVIVDYQQPPIWNPLRWVMTGVFRWLEPFAESFWRQPIELPHTVQSVQHQTLCGGLYRVLTILK